MSAEFKMVESRTPSGLEEGVNEMLDDGWMLHGSTMMASTPVGDGSVLHTYVQALVREAGQGEQR